MCWIIKAIKQKSNDDIEDTYWAVGYFEPNGTVYLYEVFDDINKAEEKCHYLNGGSLYS